MATLRGKELVESLTKDMSKGVSRIIGKKSLLDEMDEGNLKTLQQRLDVYSPKSEIGRESKTHVINLVLKRIAELRGEQVDNQASNLETAKMIENKTCMLRIEVPQPGFNMCINTRVFVEKTKNPKAKIDVEVNDGDIEKAGFDYGRHTVVQKLFGRQYLKPLISQRTEFFGWLDSHAVPSSLLSNDCRLVPHDLINDVIGRIERLTAERNALLDEFEGKYEEAKADAKEKLGIHFDPSRYPEFSTIRAKFVMFFRWQDVNPATALKTINKAAYEQQREFAKMDWDTTFDDIREGLRAGFADLVGSFADAMGNDEEGKPKVFHASKVEKLKNFLSTFEARDLTNDSDLAALAAQAKDLITTVDPKALRKDVDMRASFAEQFGKIKEQASSMVVVRTRKVKLDD